MKSSKNVVVSILLTFFFLAHGFRVQQHFKRDNSLHKSCLFAALCSKGNIQSPDKKAIKADIVIKALMISKHEDQKSGRFSGEFWLLDVYKGVDKLSAAFGVVKGPNQILHLRDQRLNVSDWESNDFCEDVPLLQNTYALFLKAKHGDHFDVVEPIAKHNEEVDEEIWKALGYGPWSPWSSCSQSCGGGTQTRRRTCAKGFCPSYDVEMRSCNSFRCAYAVNTLSVNDVRFFKPSPSHFDRVPGRGKDSWSFRPGSYFLLPFREAFHQEFPENFTIFITLRPATDSEGIIFSINARNSRHDYISLEQNEGRLEMVSSVANRSKSIDIPARISDGQWHQLAISVEQDGVMRTYLDCKWVSTLVLHSDDFRVPKHTDLIIGYMFKGEIEQLTVSKERGSVSEQCSASILPQKSQRSAPEENEMIQDLQDNDNFPEGSGEFHKGFEDDEDLGQDDGSGIEFETYHDRPRFTEWSECKAKCDEAGFQESFPICDGKSEKCGQRKRVRPCKGEPCEKDQGQEEKEVQMITQSDVMMTKMQRAWHHVGNAWDQFMGDKEDLGTHEEKEKEGNLIERRVTCKPGCQNGGICVDDNVCSCKEGYTGARCQYAFCHPPCENGGTCSAPFQCQCPPGYSGKTCEDYLCNPRCAHGGICIGPNMCACTHGFGGPTCTESTCSLHCHNGGVCVVGQGKGGQESAAITEHCQCLQGYYGKWCHKKQCHRYVSYQKPFRKTFYKVVDESKGKGKAKGSGDLSYQSFVKIVYRTMHKCAEE